MNVDEWSNPDRRTSGPTGSVRYWNAALLSRIAPIDDIAPSAPRDIVLEAFRIIDDDISAMRLAISALRERRNCLAPVSTLPPEILGRVFSECVTIDPPGRGAQSKRRLGWITVTYICRRWRAVALDIHELWSHVALSLSDRWVTEMLARAHSVPIIVDFDRHADPKNAGFFTKHLSRTKSIRFADRSDEASAGILKSLEYPTPVLESLAIFLAFQYVGRNGSNIPPQFLSDAPRLRHLSIKNPVSFPLHPYPLKSLTSLRITDSLQASADPPQLQKVLDVLNCMPALELLVLDNAVWGNRIDRAHPQSRVVPLPNLRKMRFSGEIEDCSLFLAHLRLPNEAQLILRCHSIRTGYHLPGLFDTLSTLLRGGMARPISCLAYKVQKGGLQISTSRPSTIVSVIPKWLRSTRTVRQDTPDVNLTLAGDKSIAWGALDWVKFVSDTFDLANLDSLILMGLRSGNIQLRHQLQDLFSKAVGVREVLASHALAQTVLTLMFPTLDSMEQAETSGTRASRIVLPKLKTVGIWSMDFEDWSIQMGLMDTPVAAHEEEAYAAIIRSWKARTEAGHPIKNLTIRSCTISPGFVDELKATGSTVDWDGITTGDP